VKRKASSEEEEVDPGLYMAVNDDFDSGGEDPDCEDTVVAGTAEQIAADLRDMAKLTVSMPDWSGLPPDSSIVMSVDDSDLFLNLTHRNRIMQNTAGP
jgi:hypothetical protein